MKVVIISPTIVPYDAVSNDVVISFEVIHKIYPTYIYAKDSKHPKIKNFLITKDKLIKLSQDKNNILIYHHSVYFDQLDIFINAKAKKIIKYHNITPPNFFVKYSQIYTSVCEMGISQNEQLKKIDALLILSKFDKKTLLGIRNLIKVKAILADSLNVEDVMLFRNIMIEKPSLEIMEKTYLKK